MTLRALIPALTLTLLTSALGVSSQSATGTEAQNNRLDLVDDAGHIRKPQDYRDRYQVLGAYTVLNPKGNEMHYTYASPGAAEYYRKNGQFADGTVLVKEVLATSHAQLTTGDARWAHGPEGLVRDDQGRQGALPRQSVMGRWMGLGALQVRRAGQAGRDGLQEGLPGLPHPGKEHGLDLRAGLSSSRQAVSRTAFIGFEARS